MDEPDDDGVRVTMRPPASEELLEGSEEALAPADPQEPSAVDEWEVVPSGEATVVDPEALSKLRAESADEEAKTTEVVRGTDFVAAADEFGSAPDTVMEDVQELSPAELLRVVDEGQVGALKEFEDDSVTRMDPRGARGMLEAEAVGGAKEECPHCGVLVLPGYPNCPRCKRPLLMSVPREHVPKGATSLGGRTIPWAIVFVAAVLTAVIVYLAERDVDVADSDPSGAEAAEEGSALDDEPNATEPPPEDEDISDGEEEGSPGSEAL